MADDERDAVRQDLAVTLRELAWTIHRKAPDRAGVGPIPTTEIALLKQIIDHPGATVGELAQGLGLRQPNVSAALRALLGRGLVERHQSPSDRRIASIFVTDAGVAHAAMADLDAADVDALAAAAGALDAVLRRLRAAD